MKISDKLLKIQEGIEKFVKDGTNTSDKYDYVSSEQVLAAIRPLLIEQRLLLIPSITGGRVTEGTTKSGTTRYLTEINMVMTWVDCETGDKLDIPFYAQGVDLAGEKGVGKALTYAEKYFIMKMFHVPTGKDDPDSDGRTQTGEKKQKGTQAAKETADYQRKAVEQMAKAIAGEKTTAAAVITFFTKNDAAGYAGVDNAGDIGEKALPVVFAKMSAEYKRRNGTDFKLQESAE